MLFMYIIYDILITEPLWIDNTWNQPNFFVDSPSFEIGSQYSNSLEWVLPTPCPLHAYSIIPVQS